MRNFLRAFQRSPRPPNLDALTASPARRLDNYPDLFRWKEVGGLEDAKRSLQEVVDFLRNPKRYQAQHGARIPCGILLTGPSGCGKSLLALTMMAESGCPSFCASGAEFVLMTPGIGAARLRTTFEIAAANKPCCLLIEDIDAFARPQPEGSRLPQAAEQRQVFLQLMAELDACAPARAGVILLVTTRRVDLIDADLLQPPRIDRIVRVNYPTERERLDILEVLIRRVPHDPLIDLDEIVRRTAGFSGGRLSWLMNETALLAVREDLPEIDTAAVIQVLEGCCFPV